ncbi:MAG: error-prone DNA polymerase, partial [Myxococcales bacterium]|nr:error-prone DNA polymerase [Myxococcales bacterium]
ELHTRSALSLLGGAALPEQLVERAAALGYEAIALTDEMEMGGVVRFAERARELGVGGILGSQLLLCSAGPTKGQLSLDSIVVPDDSRLVMLAGTQRAYRNICRLITRARMSCPRERPRVDPSWLPEYLEGVTVLDGGWDGPLSRFLRSGNKSSAARFARWLKKTVPPGQLFIELFNHLTREEQRIAKQLDELGEWLDIPRIVTQDARYAVRGQKPLYDLLTCVRYRTPFEQAGTRLLPNSEWHLQPIREIEARWKARPELIARTRDLAARLTFRFENLEPQLPHFPIPEQFDSDQAFLEHLTWEGARLRYPEMTSKHRQQITHELRVIERRGLSGYFLITWDIVRFCRSRGILAQGRGSAANSAVCYCLHITAIDPVGMEMLFERFLSEGRKEYPDIDVDISHEWREEAIQYVYERYGRDRAALVCEQICYRRKSSIRDTAWALGFEQDQIDRLSAELSSTVLTDSDVRTWLEQGGAKLTGVHPRDSRVPILQYLVNAVRGLPRHRSIHVGGMVLTADPLCEIVPIEPASMANRTIIQWEKDDLPYSSLAKFDLLGLGALSLVQKALQHLSMEQNEPFDLADIPADDPVVYDALCKADTIGVFQIESRAQQSTLPRLKPRKFYDLVVEIALIRPGPIQGKMVHPYLRRRDGIEPVTYLHPQLEPILSRTLGVPIFQEQVMRIAIELADFTPSQADELRRAMGFRRYSPKMEKLRAQLHEGMDRRSIARDVQDQIIQFLTAFGHYGFPESHSASFALIAYATSWLKVHHAPLFAACLINSQPMGFYSNATIIQDARSHEVECRPPDLRYSAWDCTLEPATPGGPWRHAIRVGLRCIERIGKRSRERLESARAEGPFSSVRDVIERTKLPNHTLVSLAKAGAFDGFMHESDPREQRRKAIWDVLRKANIPTQGLAKFPGKERGEVQLEALSKAELIVQDYMFTGLCTHGHPMEILRSRLEGRGVLSALQVTKVPHGRWTKVAGMAIVRQRPGTAKGFMFISLEDETGISNIIVTPQLFERYRATILNYGFLEVHGNVQVTGATVHVKAEFIYPVDGNGTPVRARNFH